MRIPTLITISLLLAACGGDNGQESAQSDAGAATPAAPEQSTAQSSSAAAPCEMLTEALVREYVDPGEMEITGEAGDTRQSNYCQYKWYYEPTEEEQQEMMDQRMTWTAARHEARRKGEPEPPAPTFPNRESLVFFNVMNPFDNAQVASSSFDLMVQRLSDGMTIDTESLGQIEVQGGEMILIEGLGDKAVWDPDDSQMSVLTGSQLFHLKVRLAFGQDSRAIVEQMASDLVERF